MSVRSLLDRRTGMTPRGLVKRISVVAVAAVADPFIPFETSLTPLFRSSRVHNAIFIPFSEYYDITQVWLSS